MNVAVFGLGKLGLPMAVVMARAGHRVMAYDVDPLVRAGVANFESHFEEPMLDEELAELGTHQHSSLLVGESVEECVVNSDIGYVIVPTPTTAGGGFTNEYVLNVVEEIGRVLRGRDGHYTLVICSTVMPGSMDGEILSTLMVSSGRLLSDGEDGIALVYSPQFIALGSVLHDMRNPDVLLIGTRQKRGFVEAKQVAESVHDADDAQIAWLKPTEAEVVKLGINTYITNKITFGNAIGQACAAVPDVDGYVVARTIGLDSRIGNKYIVSGGPYGGPCFPRDTEAFAAFVDQYTDDTGLAQLARATSDINDLVIDRVVRAAVRMANDPLRDTEAMILILGLGYKPASTVTEESYGVRVLERLRKEVTNLGVEFEIYAHDRHISHPVDFDVVFLGDPDLLAGNPDVVSIVCSPEPQYAQLTYSTVIDVWGIVPNENAGQLINYRDGNANHFLSTR